MIKTKEIGETRVGSIQSGIKGYINPKETMTSGLILPAQQKRFIPLLIDLFASIRVFRIQIRAYNSDTSLTCDWPVGGDSEIGPTYPNWSAKLLLRNFQRHLIYISSFLSLLGRFQDE